MLSERSNVSLGIMGTNERPPLNLTIWWCCGVRGDSGWPASVPHDVYTAARSLGQLHVWSLLFFQQREQRYAAMLALELKQSLTMNEWAAGSVTSQFPMKQCHTMDARLILNYYRQWKSLSKPNISLQWIWGSSVRNCAVMPHWENFLDHTHSCPGDWRLSASWGRVMGSPWAPQYNSAVMVWEVSGGSSVGPLWCRETPASRTAVASTRWFPRHDALVPWYIV